MGKEDRDRNIPGNSGLLFNRSTSTAAIFTQVKWVGDALKQYAG